MSAPRTFAQLEARLAEWDDFERLPPPDEGFGLERMVRLLGALGRPERAWPAIHVAGTKGKGTAAVAAASALDAAGLRVGLYTSPHLVDLRERVRIGSAPAPDELWLEAAGRVLAAGDRLFGGPPSWFEAVTAIAFEAFRAADVAAAVIEVGLGGRLDATNVLPGDDPPTVAVVTRIGRDHAALLGPDEASVAAEKAGILRPGVAAAVAAPGGAAATAVVRARAEATGVPLWLLGRDVAIERTPEAVAVTTPAGGFSLGRPGPSEPDRLGRALGGAAALRLGQAIGRALPGAAIEAGLARLRWRGRFDVVADGPPPVVVDGAHDVASAEALAATFQAAYPGERALLLLAINRDKDVAGILRALAPIAAGAVCCATEHPRATRPQDLAAEAGGLGVPAWAATGPQAGFEAARFRARRERCPLLVAGSLYLAGAVLELVGVDPARAW